jgi:hypothetical protein
MYLPETFSENAAKLKNTHTLTSSVFWHARLQNIGKGKAILLQAWTGPEDSRRLRLPDFKTIGTCRW